MVAASPHGSALLPRLPATLTVRLVGVTAVPSYPGGLYRAATEGAELELLREPANPFDPNAVAVRRGDTSEHLGHLRAEIARRLAPHLDAGEVWVVSGHRLQVAPKAPAMPGLTLHLERIDWATELPLPPARPLGEGPSAGGRRRSSREDPRLWAARMADAARDLPVRWITGTQFAVPSQSQPGFWHSVVVDADEHGLAWALCDCQSGACRPTLPVPCRHAAAAVSHLVESGYLKRVDRLAYRLG